MAPPAARNGYLAGSPKPILSYDLPEEMQLPIHAARNGWIQNTIDLQSIARLGLHEHTEALQVRPAHWLSLMCSSREAPFEHARMVSMSRLVSMLSRTCTETTPASLAG